MAAYDRLGPVVGHRCRVVDRLGEYVGMTAARVSGSSREGTAHPPLPRQMTMKEWRAERDRQRSAPIWRRFLGRV